MRLEDYQINLVAGLFSGTCAAGLFNPWDRALYLHIKSQRRLFDKTNWKHPYRGFCQALLGRIISGGSYFPLWDCSRALYQRRFGFVEDSLVLNFLAGNTAGAVNGVLLNSLTAVKYQTWTSGTSLVQTATTMYTLGGLGPFFKGTTHTVLRDSAFGATYAVLKCSLQHTRARYSITGKSWDFVTSLAAGSVATAASGPFNFLRNTSYATPPDRIPLQSAAVFKLLWADARSQSLPKPFYIAKRFGLGWGTLRVAVGMAVGWELYSSCKSALRSEDK